MGLSREIKPLFASLSRIDIIEYVGTKEFLDLMVEKDLDEEWDNFIKDTSVKESDTYTDLQYEEAFKELIDDRYGFGDFAEFIIDLILDFAKWTNQRVEINELIKCFKELYFDEAQIRKFQRNIGKINSAKKEETPDNSVLRISEEGDLMFNEDSLIRKIKSQGILNSAEFVDSSRMGELELLQSSQFDFSKLIALCNEVNINYSLGNYFSVALLVRSIIDHIPPIFGKRNFGEVVGGYGSKSFKDSMTHLEKSSRKIADSYLHTQIRQKESLPNKTQINFSRDLDVLLGEITRIF